MKTKEEIESLANDYAVKAFPYTDEGNVEDDIDAAKRRIYKEGFVDGYTSQFQQDRTFWGRLESFVSNVQVNDLMGEEEKEYILNVVKQFNLKQS